jgi:hypothetical protein
MSVRKVSLTWRPPEYKSEVFREHFVSLAVTQQLTQSMCLNGISLWFCLLQISVSVVTLRSSWNLLVQFTGIADWANFFKIVNKWMFIDILCRLRGVVRRKCPKMENRQLGSPSWQCSSTLVGFGQGFLTKEQCDITGAFPYSPDLAPVDFYLFPQLKSGWKGQHFCDSTDIVENVTEELKRLLPNFFQKCFNTFTITSSSAYSSILNEDIA